MDPVGASQAVKWGEAFRCPVRGNHFHLEMRDFRSERADLTMKAGYSAEIEGRTQTVLGEGIGGTA